MTTTGNDKSMFEGLEPLSEITARFEKAMERQFRRWLVVSFVFWALVALQIAISHG